MAVAIKKSTDQDVAPHWHAHAKEIQKFGTVIEDMPHYLDAKVRGKMCAKLNILLADTIALRDLYKKHHWQVSGPTFYQLHLLFDKHYEEQAEMADKIAERLQLLGGVTVAMGGDVAEITGIPRPPRGKEEVPVQISRLLEAHKIIMKQCSEIADAADDAGDQGTNDLAVSDILRPNELQSWFIGQHLVEMPLILSK
ncbi:DNA starvation/stationary phase protection protein [Granulicella sp. WH15]|uniref:Dps family protein n=1 Tax=Granulicella sp. WH15 TaxID=2602070 RepID=UPI001366A4B3|nr:DNA starvation/stationary phase protection protein [Granulicella sp. WH15]QHN03124.1 DNA starvation/stationary phase protection protein [Granulicella sp. WH15]